MNTISIELPESVTFYCSQSGESRELQLADLSPDYIAQIIGSCQVATDAMALGANATRDVKIAAWEKAFFKLQSGAHKFGGGGGRSLTVSEHAWRETIIKYARKNGALAVDAKALAQTPKATLEKWALASDTTYDNLVESLQPEVDKLIAIKSEVLDVKINLN